MLQNTIKIVAGYQKYAAHNNYTHLNTNTVPRLEVQCKLTPAATVYNMCKFNDSTYQFNNCIGNSYLIYPIHLWQIERTCYCTKNGL